MDRLRWAVAERQSITLAWPCQTRAGTRHISVFTSGTWRDGRVPHPVSRLVQLPFGSNALLVPSPRSVPSVPALPLQLLAPTLICSLCSFPWPYEKAHVLGSTPGGALFPLPLFPSGRSFPGCRGGLLRRAILLPVSQFSSRSSPGE